MNTTQTDHLARNQIPEVEIFEKLNSYPFQSDPEFAKGLSIILGHPDLPATRDEINREDDLVLQAKCFYFSRKEEHPAPINFQAYRSWLETKPEPHDMTETTNNQHERSHSATGKPSIEPSATNSNGPAPPQTQEPAYPSSFAHIVELITTGQPVPGIQEIPDTILTGQDTASTKPKRRKPWEKEDDNRTSNEP